MLLWVVFSMIEVIIGLVITLHVVSQAAGTWWELETEKIIFSGLSFGGGLYVQYR